MKTMIKILYAAALLLIINACERRPLEDDFAQTAQIPVRIDWSESGVPVEQMHRASVLLYPITGGTPLEYHLESDLTFRLIDVPVGVYSVLVFNETKDQDDWTNLTFTGIDRYETIAAEGLPEEAKAFYSRTTDLPLIKNPDPLAAWSLDYFEVTSGMVIQTRSRNRASYNIETEIPDLTHVKPQPRIEELTITARVTNLSSSMQVTGTINGMASGVYLVSGKKIPVPSAHAFLLNGRVYDDNGKDGTTTRTFNIFGQLPVPTAIYEMDVDILLHDGTIHPQEVFDVTKLIRHFTDAIIPLNTVEVGSALPPDHPIILPLMDVGGGISVDDWNEVVIPLR